MPSLNVIKTDNKETKDLLKRIEDRLIIVKESDNSGKLYFDYDNNKRLEIKSTQSAYTSNISILSDKVTLSNVHSLTTDSNINIGCLITDEFGNIGIITEIVKNAPNEDKVIIQSIHINNPLTWNDYF